MNDAEIDKAIRVYLGADNDGSVEPTRMMDRLRREYGEQAGEIESAIRAILTPLVTLSPQELNDCASLREIADLVEARCVSSYPRMAPDVRRAIGNYASYSYR